MKLLRHVWLFANVIGGISLVILYLVTLGYVYVAAMLAIALLIYGNLHGHIIKKRVMERVNSFISVPKGKSDFEEALRKL